MKLNIGKVTYSNPTIVTGDIAMCKNLKLLVIYPGTINIPAGGVKITLDSEIWMNPDHYLIDDRIVDPTTGIKN